MPSTSSFYTKKMSSKRDEKYHSHIITSNHDEPALNTPPISDIYNIENEHKKSVFVWDTNFLSSTAHTNTSTEIQLTVTTSENEIQTRTSTTESSSVHQDRFMQYSEQESSHVGSKMMPTFHANQPAESEQTIDELFRNGIDYENDSEFIAEETVDEDPSILIDTSTIANENVREPVNTLAINYLYALPVSSSNQTIQNTSANTEIFPSSDVVPYGYFRHPIKPKERMRYQDEVETTKWSANRSFITDCFSEHPIRIGPYSYLGNGDIEVTLLARTPDDEIIRSPHTFFSPNESDKPKFSNPIYLRRGEFKVENGYIKLDLQIAKTRQYDFPQVSVERCPRKKPSAYIITLYSTGEEKHVKLRARELNKGYHLDTMFLGVRRAELQSDGNSFRTDPASPIIYSNEFNGVDSRDSPKTWTFDGSKLKILKTKIINKDVSMHQNGGVQLEITLLIPELYDCALNSGSKQLEIKLMTGENINPIYKIVCGKTTGDILHLPVKYFLIVVQLTIVKQTAPESTIWLQPLLNPVDITGINHFHVKFCLQDVGITGPRSYPHSDVDSLEFIVNMSANIQPFPSANDELQHNHNVIHGVISKRRHDDNESIGEALPVTKVRKTTGE